MNSLIAFGGLALFAALTAAAAIGTYVKLPGGLKARVNEFFQLNDMEEYEMNIKTEVKKTYGPENKKPQLDQLYHDLRMLLGERSALQSALIEIQTITANNNLNPIAQRKVDNLVKAALGYDGQGGRRTVND